MTRNDSGENVNPSYLYLLKKGKKCILSKQYKAALLVLEEAVLRALREPNVKPSLLISILDLRVEAHIKQKDLEAAGRDARDMVRYDRADSRGYLRCGQLGRLKDDTVEAQRWYQQGLKNVPQATDGYTKLESMSSKTMCAIAASPRKSQDPLTVLPIDLIYMVFCYLEFYEATSCLRVSKIWRNILLVTRSLWKTLDLTGTQKDVTVKNIQACIRRLPSPPTTVRLDKLTTPATIYMRPYLERWMAVEHFTINNPGVFKFDSAYKISKVCKSLHVGERCPIYFKIVDEILHCCNALKKARFDSILDDYPPSDAPLIKVGHHVAVQRETTLPELTDLVLISKLRMLEGPYWVNLVSLHLSRLVLQLI